MQELRGQHLELMEVERMMFAGAGSEVIVISSSDDVKDGEDGCAEGGEVGTQDEEIDVDEWRSIFHDDKNDDTDPDANLGTP
ncbi:Zinc finger protein CONSTANS-LIKE 13 [Hordeum vulgare]|nr:Zinc finger protein CONSTANS-LIKE 13 [Hordeum vulgare]